MRKFYLASDSRARKELLNILGLKFKVLPGRIKEISVSSKLAYPEIVKRNALKKAKEASSRVKGGVVIAADTIVVQGNSVYGKPKDLAHARRMLKSLSRRPQWIYTGVAVIDTKSKKAVTGCEKTKIYMDKLSDKEINEYFKHVSPLDKAGSFDIQGKGAFFINRIEGCFYNVVGLPLRRLYRMLKEIGVKVFMFIVGISLFSAGAFLLSGCSTEYNIVTGQEESYYYSTDREVTIGKSIVREVEKEYKLDEDPLIQKRVEDIGKKIVAVCDRKDIDYTFKVLDDDEINAVSLPGGFVYINKGLIDKVANDDELACVIAHEVGHIVARHSIKKLQAIQGYSILRLLIAVAPATSGSGAGGAADIAFTELLLGYGRDDELLADQLASRYAKRAGYNPKAMIDFLERLQEINRRKPLRPKTYFKTHPYVPDRIRTVKQELGQKMDFEDYINIEETKGP